MRQKQHSTQRTPIQAWETNTRTTPVNHEKTTRTKMVSVVTSSFGGKLVPLKAEGMFREDGILNSTVSVNLQMAETAKMLLNPVRIAAAAYVVPKLALERFKDMGTIDRSYNGQEEVNGEVVPWFQTVAGQDGNEILETLGIHYVPGENINLDYVEAYNCIWNYIATNRSPSIALRQEHASGLAPAFWANTQMKHVVPTFDDAMIEGEIPLNVTAGNLPVRGINFFGGVTQLVDSHIENTANEVTLTEATYQNGVKLNKPAAGGIYAELVEDGITVSLANIDLARETAAWARLRTQYQGKSEEWMMDQLLAGMRIPDEGLRYPILLDTQETIVGMSQRYASDSDNLTKSVVDGRTSLQLRLRAPAIPCGGVLMIVAQALPEQIYERQVDYYMQAQTVADLPNRISDELDPQPVEMVANKEVDAKHSDADGLFGYAPLNHRWTGGAPNVGGRYYRPDPNAAWDEDRNRIWDTGVVDPQLGPDFYMSSSLQHNVFETQNEDPFEWWVGGSVSFSGLTYFGPSLRESTDDYDSVLGKVDTTRLKGDGTDTPS